MIRHILIACISWQLLLPIHALAAEFTAADLVTHACIVTASIPIMDGDTEVGVKYKYECLEDPSVNCNPDPASCTKSSATCTGTSDKTGRCISEISNYSCTKVEAICLNEVIKSTCFPIEINTTQELDDSFADVAAAMKLAELLSENMDMVDGEPRIFNGEKETCHEVTSNGETYLLALEIGGPITASTALVLDQFGEFNSEMFAAAAVNIVSSHDLDCCKPSPTQVDPAFMFCDDKDIKIATSIENNTSVKVGETTKYICLVPGIGDCAVDMDFMRYQHYCIFPDMLSKIIQEQGREQLNAIITSGYAGAEEHTLSFNYYGTNSGWLPPQNINGTLTSIFQRSEFCKDSGLTLGSSADYLANKCDKLVDDIVYVALCDEKICDKDELKTPPFGGRFGGWSVIPLNAYHGDVIAWSNWIVAGGHCEPDGTGYYGECSYQISAMNPQVDGNTRQTTQLGWLMWGENAGWSESQWIGNMELQYEIELFGGITERTEVEIRYRHSEDEIWQFGFIPARIEGKPFRLIDTPPTDVIGSCDWRNGFCSYTFMVELEVVAKPWLPDGNAANPDCSGFTIDQVMLLDFDKMDLEEFTESLSEDMAPERADMIAAALSSGKGVSDGAKGNIDKTVQEKANILHITPDQGIAPTMIQAYVPTSLTEHEVTGGAVVDNSITVNSVMINWGDGQQEPMSIKTVSIGDGSGSGFSAEHNYTYAEDFQITATLYTSEGEKTIISTIHIGAAGLSSAIHETGSEQQYQLMSLPQNSKGDGTFDYSEYESGGVRKTEIEITDIPLDPP